MFAFRTLFFGLLAAYLFSAPMVTAAADAAAARSFLQEFAPAYVVLGPSSGKAADEERFKRAFDDVQRRKPEYQSLTQNGVKAVAAEMADVETKSLRDRAMGAFYLGRYSEAEEQALKAGDAAHRADPRQPDEIAQALHLASLAAAERGDAESTLKYIKIAQGETDPAKELLTWAQVQSTLAHLHWRTGATAEQILILRKIHAEFLRIVGPDHAHTLHHHNELAAALYDDKQDAAAAEELTEILTQTQKNHGADDAKTVSVRKNLARVLESQELFEEAEPHRRAVVESQRKTAGADDRATLRSREQLVQNLIEQRKFAESTTEAIGLLEQSQRVLGPEDLTTLICRSRLARCQFEQGEIVEAETQLRLLYDYELKTLGAEHRETLNTGHDLGACLNLAGKHEEAVKQLETVLKRRLALLPQDHRDTLETRAQLGQAYEKINKLAEAELEYRAALTVIAKTLGEEHPKTVLLKNRVNKMLESPEAKILILSNALKAAESAKAEHGTKDIRTLNARLGYAAALSEQKKYAEAEKEYREVHVALTRLQKEETAQSLMLLREVANCLGNQEKLKEAEEVYVLVLKKMRLLNQKPDPEMVRTLNMHGLCLLRLNRLDEARAAMEACLKEASLFPDVSASFMERAQLILNEILRLQREGGTFSADGMANKARANPTPAPAAANAAPIQVPAAAVMPSTALPLPGAAGSAPALPTGDTINKPLPFK